MKIAILGLGTVGRGVYEIIRDEFSPAIQTKYGLDIRPLDDLDCIRADHIDQILADPEVELVVEAMGGIHPAFEFVKAALSAKKHVVTPNKQLISSFYEELHRTAEQNGVRLLYTSSAGGGIPWLHNLCRTKRSGRIESFSGIINGTTNYILDTMNKAGSDFQAALMRAQELGYAEADPSADIDGTDVQRKCAISANLAFDAILSPEDIATSGIRYIKGIDIETFSHENLICKLMCHGMRDAAGKISAYVEPTLVHARSLEANVADNNNLISLSGKYIGTLSFYGQGAGRYPTAHSLVQDIVDIYLGSPWEAPQAKRCSVDNEAICHRYYVRADDTAFLAGIATVPMGAGLLTQAVSVKRMHEITRRAIASGNPVFFASLADSIALSQG